MNITQGDTVNIESINTVGTVAGFMGKKVLVNVQIDKQQVQIKCHPEDLTVIDTPNIEIQVICYHCGKLILKSKAYYLEQYDAYYCSEHWLAILDGKPIKTPNYRRGDA